MATESLTYAQIAERLNINSEAARSLVRRHRLPRQTANDGKVVVLLDLAELAHKKLNRPLAAVDQPETSRLRLEELWDRIAALEADLRLANERAAGLRSDYERERDRGDRLLAIHEAELGAMRKALEDRMEADRSPDGDHAAEQLAEARAAADKATADLAELARRLATIAEKQTVEAEPEPPRRSAGARVWRWFLRN
jgi:hypothetical protein